MINLSLHLHLDDPRWEVFPDLSQKLDEIANVMPDKAVFLASRNSKENTGNLVAEVILVNDAYVQTLNNTFRQKNKPTNVLSFPLYSSGSDGILNLGEVYLAYETIKDEANKQGKSFDDHLIHLIVHGILHLLGYDHEDSEEANKMEAVEVSILSLLRIDNPYAEMN